ncbi:MAG TPA: VOC family protein [Actinomycetota bacterium]|nr:VOC family protein [Actinomycetota bacterium]
MGNPVGHFEIMGTDAGQLRDFYTGIFGWAVQHGPDEGDPLDYTMISTQSGDGALGGGIGKNPEGRGVVTFYINVDNLEDTLAKIEAAGGSTLRGRLQVGPNVSIAMFGDPDGNVVGLVEELAGPAAPLEPAAH